MTDTNISFFRMFYVNCQGAIMDSITPGVKFGGEVTRAVQISRFADCTPEKAASVVALQKLFSMSSLFFILLFVVGFLFNETAFLSSLFLQIMVYGGLLAVLLLFGAIFCAPVFLKSKLESSGTPRFKWVRRVKAFMYTLFEQVIKIRGDMKKCLLLLLLAFFIWFLFPVKLYITAILFIPDISPIFVGATAFSAYMVALIPVFPGGLGGFEGVMTGLLTIGGFQISDAAAVTIFFRFITFWFVMLGSLIFVGAKGLRKFEV